MVFLFLRTRDEEPVKAVGNGVGSTLSKRAKLCAGDLSGMPHSRCVFAPREGVPVSPPEIRKPPSGGFLIEKFRVLELVVIE